MQPRVKPSYFEEWYRGKMLSRPKFDHYKVFLRDKGQTVTEIPLDINTLTNGALKCTLVSPEVEPIEKSDNYLFEVELNKYNNICAKMIK